ncbi:MAG: tyrosine--tRNA ligase [Phycisphaerae bacterium]|nr:tyrosine--tRNA ligase [Phycisphaerae bacterium]
MTDPMTESMEQTIARQVALLQRGCETLYTPEELTARLTAAAKEGKQLRLKYGMDPTAPDVHLGHSVQLRMLRRLQNLGHRVVLIIGDYTAMIGDPSGRDSTRPMLSLEEIQKNARTYIDQAGLILDTSAEKLEVRRNSEWLENLRYADMLGITGMATVQQMIARENFKKRLEAGREIVITELLYPLMQGYDSIAIRADVEFGGSDQTFNCLLGRDMMAKKNLPRQIVLITPILEGLDGVEKMSKSKGNYVGVTDEPNDMFGKIMSIPDKLMNNFYTLLTDLPADEIATLTNPDKTHPRQAKADLAKRIVTQYHSADAADAAAAEFDRVFAEKKVPTDMPEISVPAGEINIIDLILTADFAPSKKEARRLIQQNAVTLDDEKITDINANVTVKPGAVLKVGKRRFGKITEG